MNIKKEKVYPIQISLICPFCNIELVSHYPNLTLPQRYDCEKCGYSEVSNKSYPHIEFVTKEEFDKIK